MPQKSWRRLSVVDAMSLVFMKMLSTVRQLPDEDYPLFLGIIMEPTLLNNTIGKSELKLKTQNSK